MTRAAAKYLELTRELGLARLDHELRRSPFTQAEEVEYVSELDHWWRQMTDEEHDAIERELAVAPEAPDKLPVRDVEVEIGTETGPRHEAA